MNAYLPGWRRGVRLGEDQVDWRATALAVYRFWRDSGYAIGALIGAITAVLASLDTAVAVAAALTTISGLLALALHDRDAPAHTALS